MTVEINLNDADYKTVSEYAAKNNISISDFIVSLVREHFEEFNEETIEAMREANLIAEGKIPAKSYNIVEELLEDLMNDEGDYIDDSELLKISNSLIERRAEVYEALAK